METKEQITEFLIRLLEHSVGGDAYVEITNEQKLVDSGIDSFGFVMLYLTAGELYGIEQDVYDNHLAKDDSVTLGKYIDFIVEYKTKAPTPEEAEDVFN